VARIININDYNKLTKLLAVTAYVRRFARRTLPITTDTHVSPTELAVATVKWIHVVHNHFPAEAVTITEAAISTTVKAVLGQGHAT